MKEKSFPRGGSEKPFSHQTVKRNVEKDLFNVSLCKKKGKKRKFVGEGSVSEQKSDPYEPEPEVVAAVPLTYKTLCEGMLVLGSIQAIHNYELVVTMPGRLVGKVPIIYISEPYTSILEKIIQAETSATEDVVYTLFDMFHVGQHVSCRVMGVEQTEKGKKHIVTLSLSPQHIHKNYLFSTLKKKMVLVAAVKSVEDHGYVMDLGIVSVRAFLTTQAASKYIHVWNSGKALGVGQLVQCIITRADITQDTATVLLSANPESVTEQIMLPFMKITIHSMLPGMLFSVTVQEAVTNGLKVKCLYYDGYVLQQNLVEPWDDPNDYKVGTVHRARLLYVQPIVNIAYLSLQKNLDYVAPFDGIFSGFHIGDMINDAEIMSTSSCGICLKVGGKQKAYISAWQTTNKKNIPEDWQKLYPVGSKHSCRIIQFDFLSNEIICTMRKSLLSEIPLSLESLNIGDVINCRIKLFQENGIIVTVGEALEGFIPKLHIANVPIKHPEKKFHVNEEVKCRVLKLNPKRRQLHLTNKSHLVKLSSPIITTYEEAEVGMITEGCVVSIEPTGLLITLFGEVKGFVPNSMISSEPIVVREDLFFVGQVVCCQVVRCEPQEQKLTLTLVIDGKKSLTEKKESLIPGSFVKCKVTEVRREGLTVAAFGNNIEAHIPKQHLTDHVCLAQHLLDTYKVGRIIEEAVCFQYDVKPILTLKPSIICTVKEGLLPKDFKDLIPGIILPGVIQKIQKSGITIRIPAFAYNKNIFVPFKNLTDDVVESIKELGLVKHQSLFCKIKTTTPETEQVTVSIRMKDCFPQDVKPGLELLDTYLAEVHQIQKDGFPYHVGQLVSGNVKAVTDDVTVELSGGISATVSQFHCGDMMFNVGDTVEGVVLFMNLMDKSLELTLRPDLIKLLSRCRQSSGKLLKKMRTVRGSVVLIKDSYVLLCALDSAVGQLVYLPVRQNLNDFLSSSKMYALGEVYTVHVKCVSSGCLLGVLQLPDSHSSEQVIPVKNIGKSSVPLKGLSPDKNERKRKVSSVVDKDCKMVKKPKSSMEELNCLDNVADTLEVSSSMNLHYDGEGKGKVRETKKKQKVNSDKEDRNVNESGSMKKLRKLDAKHHLGNEEKATLIESVRNDHGVSISKKDGVELKNKVQKNKEELKCLDNAVEVSALNKSTDSGSPEADKIKSAKKVKKEMTMSTTEKEVGKVKENKILKKKVKKMDKDKKMEKKEDTIFLQSPAKDYSANISENKDGVKVKKVIKSMKSLTANSKNNEIKEEKKTKKKNIKKAFSVKEDENIKENKNVVERAKKNHGVSVLRKEDLPRLKDPGGFTWDVSFDFYAPKPSEEAESSSDESDDNKEKKEPKKKITKAEKIRKARQEEEKLREREFSLMDAEREPQTADEFDRMVLASPDSSLCWIKYMAFHLQATEIDKARAVAQRALKTIAFREEQEKLNVWVALLNLENLYGTQETLSKTFEQAVRVNEALNVYKKMVHICVNSNKNEQAEHYYKIMTKKFSTNKDVWIDFGTFYMKTGRFDSARKLMQRSLQSLNKKEHINVISKFAQLEYKMGTSDRGKTMFDHILANYPKRTDLWSLYCDLLVKSGDLSAARESLERATSLKLNPKKMKFLFKKYMEYEKKYGTEETIEHVKQKAQDYVHGSVVGLGDGDDEDVLQDGKQPLESAELENMEEEFTS